MSQHTVEVLIALLCHPLRGIHMCTYDAQYKSSLTADSNLFTAGLCLNRSELDALVLRCAKQTEQIHCRVPTLSNRRSLLLKIPNVTCLTLTNVHGFTA